MLHRFGAHNTLHPAALKAFDAAAWASKYLEPAGVAGCQQLLWWLDATPNTPQGLFKATQRPLREDAIAQGQQSLFEVMMRSCDLAAASRAATPGI
ncbi:MAG: hypothetical protein ACM3ZE_24065, partial [Myxococcales bacterium]